MKELVEIFKEINLKNVLKLTVYYHCFKMNKKIETGRLGEFLL